MMMVVMFWRNNAMCWLSKRWRMEMGLRIGVDGQCKKQPALYITAGGILYCTLYSIHTVQCSLVDHQWWYTFCSFVGFTATVFGTL